MKNIKRILNSMLVIIALFVSACGDDNATPKSQFSFEEEDAVSLKGAHLYLLSEETDGNGHIFRNYFITDGTFDAGSGWSLEDYTDATYLMAVQLGVPEDDEKLSDGKYPMYHSFSNAPETSRISWISFDTTTDIYYEIPEDALGDASISISGDYDDGDTMTIKFNGTLTHFGDSEVAAEGKLYFKGEVEDERSPAPAP
jgi:hypothetical protein